MEIRPLETDKIISGKVGKVARENLYEMTRKYWVMKLERAEKATHVLAIINGTVEAVYIPTEWKYSEERIGRCEFIGYEEYDSDYIGKNVTRFYGKSQNPVKYINM